MIPGTKSIRDPSRAGQQGSSSEARSLSSKTFPGTPKGSPRWFDRASYLAMDSVKCCLNGSAQDV